VLLAYGGAGPTHAFLFADEVGIRTVLIPPSPGTLCALGCIVADLRNDFVSTMYRTDRTLTDRDLEAAFADLEARGRRWLAAEQAAGARLESSYVQYSADMRYEGQAFEIEVAIPAGERVSVAGAVQRFHKQYHDIFGVSDAAAPVDFINLRATAVGVTPKIVRLEAARAAGPARRATRPISWRGRLEQAAVVPRSLIALDERIAGPAVVEQYDTTVFVPPGYIVRGAAHGNLIGEVA
jgi:N-methylhydantoinase A